MAPKLERKLTRSSTFRETIGDAAVILERARETFSDGLEDASSFLDPAVTVEAIETVLQQQEQVGERQQEAQPAASETSGAEAEPGTDGQPKARRSKARLVEAMGRQLLEPTNVVLRDKISFVMGVCNVMLTSFWLGYSPATYYHYWVVKAVLLFTLRYFLYKARGMHLMMLEFCYFANMLGAYMMYIDPQNAYLRKLAFAQMSGPLLWAILAMRNSMVFHDPDRMTTLMMHSSPALVAWCMRWHPRPEWTAGMSPQQLHDYNTATWFQMLVLPMQFYLMWMLMYYFLTFLVLAKRIRRKGYANMFTHMVLREQAKKSGLARLVLKAPRPLQPIAYLSMHMLASWLALLPTKLLWDHFWVHTLVLGAILLQSVWNGANFYFKVFAKRYMAQLEARQATEAESKKQP